MSTAPIHGTSASVPAGAARTGAVGTAGGKGGAAGPGAAAKPARSPEQTRNLALVGAVAALVLLLAAGVVYYFSALRGPTYGEPPLNGEPREMAAFAASSKFEALEFDRQRLWMKTIGDKKKEIEQLFADGKVTRDQYEDALAVVWLGKQFNHVDKYFSMRHELDRKQYLDELIDKDMKEDALKPKDKSAPKRDPKKIKAIVERFPAEQRTEYEQFRKALDRREKELDKEAKAKRKEQEKAAQSRPTSRPTTRSGK